MILKCFISKDINVLLRSYFTYVRPILEYNSVVWSPVLKCEIDALERVQRRFTKRLRGMDTLSYTDRLVKLELITLELRRLHSDLVMCYKIVFGLIDVQFSAFFSLSPSEVTRGHQITLELRCLHNDLIMCYKITFGLVEIQFRDFFLAQSI